MQTEYDVVVVGLGPAGTLVSLLLNDSSIRILGIDKGTLQKGKDADLCIIDINKPWVVNKSKLKSKSKNTPIENRKLQGVVLKTFVKGNLLYERN